MSSIDLAVAEGHLDMALRHLETVSAILKPSVVDTLDTRGRADLNGLAAEAGVLIDRIVRTIAGDDFERELARFADVVDS